MSSGSNSKWPTYRHFCLLKLTKYLKMLSVRINISNTNAHFFRILYTCINYHPPMKKWPTYCHFCLLKLTNYLKMLSVQMNISNTNEPFCSDTLHMHLLQSSHESCEVSSWSNSKWPTNRHFCLLKLTKYLKMLFIRINISNTNEYFFSDTLHIHLLQSSHESCEVSSGSNSKWPTYRHFYLFKLTKYLKMLSVQINISNTNEHFFRILYTCINYHPPMKKWPTYCHFCLLKLTNYLKMLSVQMNISNTNEYFFPILYTCIYYNPPMNPVKCRQDQIQNGRLIAICVCLNWQNIWKCCPLGWISPNTNEYLFLIIYTCIYYNPPWILITYNRVFTRWGIPLFQSPQNYE